MKVSFVTFLTLSLLVIRSSYGQRVASLHIGVTAGVNSSLIRQEGINSHLLWGYNTGLCLDQVLSPSFSLIYQLYYSRQGSSHPVTGLGGNDRVITALDYTNLISMLRYRPKRTSLFFEAGLQGGYLLKNNNYFASAKSQGYAASHIKAWDFGYTIGTGYQLNKHLVIDIRYFNSTVPLLANYTLQDPITGITSFHRSQLWYNRTGSLNLSYFF